MADAVKHRVLFLEIALDNYGCVTTKKAAESSMPATELPKLAARGWLENVFYGLSRVTDVPVTAFDQFAEARLRVG